MRITTSHVDDAITTILFQALFLACLPSRLSIGASLMTR
ncbi:hypothetical protein CORC01_03325 [Colletotrichum orchidophilum]|uniref:Uncharacterized protein n=1 Tax=Colletotrichum orchidophilum TaxID=1209926 RepID=A0A1G4BIM8_9PEZI|nr:uncharacterized protein CORC01_03325 [Colletotrichum orchidophilum]OHF01292.1 hypothetical protein CORC01_03325 [Colletotrichum orchidophilum]